MEIHCRDGATPSQLSLKHALFLAERATSLERSGRYAEADQTSAQVRNICSQSPVRNVGEFVGYGMRGVANGVAAVGGAIGQGLADFGGGVVGGWTGQYAPEAGPRVKMQDRPDTAHMPSSGAVAWARKQGTTLDEFITRCEKWAGRNGRHNLVPHLNRAGIPGDVVKYVNRMIN